MDLGTVTNVVYLATVVIGVAVGVYTVARKIERKLDLIQAETQPNHGSSLRDAIDRITVAVDKIDERQDRMEKEFSNLCGRFDEHARRAQ